MGLFIQATGGITKKDAHNYFLTARGNTKLR